MPVSISGDLSAHELVIVGLNHKTAPIQIRERCALTEESQRALTITLGDSSVTSAAPQLSGAVVLSTCNRVELYSAAPTASDETLQPDLETPADRLIAALARETALDERELREHIYIHRGDEAVRHLFRVASSLDSLVVGEAQILGQLKSALELSHDASRQGAVHSFMERAFMVARRVRRETAIGEQVVSVSSVAVRLARHIFDDLSDRVVLLVGAGEMGELAARHLCQEGVGRLLVANRSLDRAIELAQKLNGHPRGLDELPTLLEQADIVITSTGAREPIITEPLAQRVIRARKYRPLFFIDIAVPRNVAPAINELDNIYVYDVDDLTQITHENLTQRQAHAREAEELVHEEVQRFYRDCAQRSLGPTIVEVRAHAHELKEREIDWALSKSVELTAEQEQLLRHFGDRLVNKVLHDVMTGMKRYADHPERARMLDVVSELFALEPRASRSSDADPVRSTDMSDP